MISLIYKITNNINGKIYIGKYRRNPNVKNFLKFENYWGSGTYIKRAIKKHGRENFTKEIIVRGDFNKKELCDLEIYYIKKYDATNPEVGYNLTIGGDGGTSIIVSESTRRKLSAVHKGKKKSKEHAKNIAKAKCKKVYQYRIDGLLCDIWESAVEIEKTLGFSRKCISNCVRKKNHLTENYIWTISPEDIEERLYKLHNNQFLQKHVNNYTDLLWEEHFGT